MDTINITGSITHETADPISVELARGQRGSYGWTIKVKGDHAWKVLRQADEIDKYLRNTYLNGAQDE